MHPNPVFSELDSSRNIAFARMRAFGTLAINGDTGPLTAHIPFLLSEDGSQLELHLVRSNPIVAALDGVANAVLTVLGPDGYVSPDWYGVRDQVPTWNYVAVRICGKLQLEPQDRLHDLLDRQSAHFEDQISTKPPWVSSKMSDGVMTRMMRAIVPLRMDVAEIQGTWKLGQNKPEQVRQAAADQMQHHTLGVDIDQLSEMMRQITKETP